MMKKFIGFLSIMAVVSAEAEPLKVAFKSGEGVVCDGKTLVFDCGTEKAQKLAAHGQVNLDKKFVD